MMDLPRLWTFGTLWCLSRLIVNDASLVLSPHHFFFQIDANQSDPHTHTHTVPIMSTAWSTYFPGPIVGDNQYTAQVVRVADRKGRSRGFVISGHRGVIWVGSFFFFFYLLIYLC